MARQSCKVCYAEVDGFGDIEHGKGCYQYRAEGGGIEHVGFEETPRRSPIGTAYESALSEHDLWSARTTYVKWLEDAAQHALDRDSIAEHDLLQIALTQLDEVRLTVERARKARGE